MCVCVCVCVVCVCVCVLPPSMDLYSEVSVGFKQDIQVCLSIEK